MSTRSRARKARAAEPPPRVRDVSTDALAERIASGRATPAEIREAKKRVVQFRLTVGRWPGSADG